MTEENQTPEEKAVPEPKPLICSACGELGYYVARRGRTLNRPIPEFSTLNRPAPRFAVRCDRALKAGGPVTACCETESFTTREQAAERWFKLHDNKV
jgi:hypothetical protein